jgi:hypothetical protein
MYNVAWHAAGVSEKTLIAAIFYTFSQFCEIGTSSLSLQKEQKTDPSLFQRGVEYGRYDTPWEENAGGRTSFPTKLKANSDKLTIDICYLIDTIQYEVLLLLSLLLLLFRSLEKYTKNHPN